VKASNIPFYVAGKRKHTYL